eukprot:UN18345
MKYFAKTRYATQSSDKHMWAQFAMCFALEMQSQSKVTQMFQF